MTASVWDPEQYQRFRAERKRPFHDLVALIRPLDAPRVVDLGCGGGALTRELHRALGARETVGVDDSETMLAGSDRYAGDGVRFARADLATFDEGAPYDVVFSNAALHWVADHRALLERLTGRLTATGQLAVQVPANHDRPSHTVMNDVAREPPFADALGGYVKPSHVLAPEDYARELHRLGYAEQHVRLQIYAHELPGREDVIEWVRGTTLTDYQKRLPSDLFDAFVARYRERLFEVVPDERPLLFPFARILFWGARSRSRGG